MRNWEKTTVDGRLETYTWKWEGSRKYRNGLLRGNSSLARESPLIVWALVACLSPGWIRVMRGRIHEKGLPGTSWGFFCWWQVSFVVGYLPSVSFCFVLILTTITVWGDLHRSFDLHFPGNNSKNWCVELHQTKMLLQSKGNNPQNESICKLYIW